MLKKEIKYTTFNDDEVNEVFYFHLSKPELVRMDASPRGGLGAFITKLIETDDRAEILKQFEDLILLSYGEKSQDGKRFIKTEELREAFAQTPAYEVLFMELTTDLNAAADFLKGVLPKEMGNDIEKNLAELAKTTS